VLTVPGRRRRTYLPTTNDPDFDPAVAWLRWKERQSEGLTVLSESHAFSQCSFTRVWMRTLSPGGLNKIVQDACARASLDGRYVFSSLRTGAMRSALRDADARIWEIGAHADLRSLASVQRHEQRETLLAPSGAVSRLGL
jgi:hypothetical protein